MRDHGWLTCVPGLRAGCEARTHRRHPRTAPGPHGPLLSDTVRQSAQVAAADGRYREYPEYIVRVAALPFHHVPAPAPDYPRPSRLRSSNICREAATTDRRTLDR